jgi:hypothetical protein
MNKNNNQTSTNLCIDSTNYLVPNTFLPTNIEQILIQTPYLNTFAFDVILPDFLPPSGYRFNQNVDRVKCILSALNENDKEYQKYLSRFKKLINTPTNYFKPKNLCGYPWVDNLQKGIHFHSSNSINSTNSVPIDWIGKIQKSSSNQVDYVYIVSNFSEANICEGLYENKTDNYVLQFWFKHKYLNDWLNIISWLDKTIGNWQKYATQANYVCDIIDNSM